MEPNAGTATATILVKAAPHYGKQHGELVCCAGVDERAQWVRLFPVTFRYLKPDQKFGRWQKIKYSWRKPDNDPRPESRRIDHESIEIIGELKQNERTRLLDASVVTSLANVREQDKTLALLRPRNPRFIIERKSDQAVYDEALALDAYQKQGDLFTTTHSAIPLTPCPFVFKYAYQTDDGDREGTCQDWETDATFFNFSKRYGEAKALELMQKTFGQDYPKHGMVFAMGTHSRWPDQWLINGVIRLDEPEQASLF